MIMLMLGGFFPRDDFLGLARVGLISSFLHCIWMAMKPTNSALMSALLLFMGSKALV
jgi:hypothetical protein